MIDDDKFELEKWVPPKAKKSAKESEIQKQILDWLNHSGFMAWKNHVGPVFMSGRMAPNPCKGSADIFAIKQGMFFAIEVKTPIGVLAPHQKLWLERARSYGAIALVATSVEECDDKIRKALKRL